MSRTRAHIRLMTNHDAVEFVSMINSDGSTIKYSLESGDGKHRVDARSLLGVLYFITEHNEDTYLVNDTIDNAELPPVIDKFRV